MVKAPKFSQGTYYFMELVLCDGKTLLTRIKLIFTWKSLILVFQYPRLLSRFCSVLFLNLP